MNIFKFLFGTKQEDAKPENTCKVLKCEKGTTLPRSAYIDEKEQRDAEYEKAKLEWERKNNLKKEIDACYLYTQKTSFSGTYEEYLNSLRKDNPSNLRNLAAMQAAQAAQSGNPYYQGMEQLSKLRFLG